MRKVLIIWTVILLFVASPVWAGDGENLTVDLQSYYPLDGDYITPTEIGDYEENINCTNANTLANATGIIDDGTDSDDANDESVNCGDNHKYSEYTFNMWFQLNNFANNDFDPFGCTGGAEGSDNWLYWSDGPATWYWIKGNGASIITFSQAADYNAWVMLTLVTNATGSAMYIDGYMNGTSTDDNPMSICGSDDLRFHSAEVYNQGGHHMDEIGVWNRTLTIEEIQYLWNNGEGIARSDWEGETPVNNELALEVVHPVINHTYNNTINFILNASDLDGDDVVNCEYADNLSGYLGNDSSITVNEFNSINLVPSVRNEWVTYNFTCYSNDTTSANAIWNIYINNSIEIDWSDENIEDGYVINESTDVYYWFNCSDISGGTLSAHLSLDGTVQNSSYDFANGINQSLSFSSGSLSNGNHTITLTCDDGSTNVTDNKVLRWDATPPDIPLIGQAFPLYDNFSRALTKASVPINISCGDSSQLWSFMINLSIDGTYIWGFYVEDLNVTNYTYDTPLDLSAYGNSSVLTETVCYDSHTKTKLKHYYHDEDLDEAMLSYHTGDKGIIIKGVSSEGLIDIDTVYSWDRYNYIFDYSGLDSSKKEKDGKFVYEFLVYSDKEIKKKSESNHKGHLIINQGDNPNWIDFNLEGDDSAKVKLKYLGDNIWSVEVKTHLKKLVFKSQGELNKGDASASFYLGDSIDLISPVNNSLENSSTVSFNCSMQHSKTITNITLVIDGVENETTVGTSNYTFLEEDVNLAEGSYEWTCHGYDGDGVYTNSSAARNIIVSPDFPEVNLVTDMENLTEIDLPVNNELDTNASSIILDSCFYSVNDAANVTYTCNSSFNIQFNSSDFYKVDYCANDSLNRETCGSVNFTLSYVTASLIQEKDVLGDFDNNVITLFVNKTPLDSDFDSSSFMPWNSIHYNYSSRSLIESGLAYQMGFGFIVPNNTGSIGGNNISYSIFYDLPGLYTNLTVNSSQLVYQFGLGNCTDYNRTLLNFTLRDEETRSINDIANGSIRTDVIAYSPGGAIIWEYSGGVNFTNVSESLDVCIAEGVNNFTNYTLDTVTTYVADDHVVEYHYLDSFILSNGNIPQLIDLYDLATADSTSFLVNYQDENYLYVEDAVIDVARRYVGDGISLSVEHGLTNDVGQTRLHLITEDIKYVFTVRKDGEVLYTSPEYLALCQTTPCVINLLDAEASEGIEGVAEEGLSADFEFDADTRTITMTYATVDGSTSEVELVVVLENAYMNDTICLESASSSSGSLSCTIPEAWANSTYYVNVSNNGVFVSDSYFNLNPGAFDTFGYTGIIMVTMLFLTLSLMAVFDGVAVVVFGLLGLIFAIPLTLFDGGSVIGVGSSLLWVIVAGCIILYKIIMKKRF